MLLGGAQGRSEDQQQLVRFFQKIVDSLWTDDICFAEKFEPKNRFIRFFDDDGHPRNKFYFGPRTTDGAVVCRD